MPERLALYPMVEETRAEGRVAAVYAAALEQAPFVPSLLKSLALCPAYLVLAWEQLAPVLGDERTRAAAAELVAAGRGAARPLRDPADRERLGAFAEPLSLMLLSASGLRAALDGELAGRPPAAGEAPPAPAGALEPGLPSAAELKAPELFGDIRARLGTPIVNTIWRRMAHEGRLEPIWSELAGQVAGALAPAEAIRGRARDAAVRLAWERVADEAALRGAGVSDAAAGVRAVLDAYLLTLPRVLALVASSAPA